MRKGDVYSHHQRITLYPLSSRPDYSIRRIDPRWKKTRSWAPWSKKSQKNIKSVCKDPSDRFNHRCSHLFFSNDSTKLFVPGNEEMLAEGKGRGTLRDFFRYIAVNPYVDKRMELLPPMRDNRKQGHCPTLLISDRGFHRRIDP